ncbi:hypothetical protein E4T39_01047 [Aureobasidium subglaciale]|nr:hypothetical protein E4T39_01047 [Aureobasidium subglaciale]
MGTYKELLAQGLQVRPTAYPVPSLNVNGVIVYIFQRVIWTGNLLDARLECIEVPVNDLPHTTTTQHQQSPPSRDMFTQRNPFSKQDLAPSYPSPPKRDEDGKFPSKPENLPARPQRSKVGYVHERSFGQLISTERPLTIDETMARDSQFLVELQGWRSWASRMPQEWDLLDPVEYEQLNSFQTAAPSQANEDTQVDKTSQTLLLFCIVGLLLWYFGDMTAGSLLGLAFLAAAVTQINNQNGLAPSSALLKLIFNPTIIMNLIIYRVLEMLVVFLVSIFAAVTSAIGLVSRVVALFHLATGLVVVLLAFSNYMMLLYPSTLGLLACVLLCLLTVICMLVTFTQRPSSERVSGSSPAGSVTPSPAVLAPRASTPLSISTKPLLRELRSRALIHDFGTPTRGPMGGAFGARRSPPELFEPAFFSSPWRQTFS